MKVFAILALFSVVAFASAAVLPEDIYDGKMLMDDGKIIDLGGVDNDGGLPTVPELPPIRHRRITCDVLSFSTPFGELNHSGCAIKCITQGRKGGFCSDGACICR